MINYDRLIDMIPTVMKDNTLKYASKSIRTKNYHTRAITNYMKSRNWNMEGFYLYYSDNEEEIYFVYSDDVPKYRITESMVMRDGITVNLIFADNVFNKNKTDAELIRNINQTIYELESDYNFAKFGFYKALSFYSHMITLYAIDHCLNDYLDREAREMIEAEKDTSIIFDKHDKKEVLEFINEYMDSDDKKDFILSIIEAKDYTYIDRAEVVFNKITD